MLNHITIMGRLTADPELRYTQNSTPVASFSLAVERDFGDKTTDFISCVAWRQTGEFISKYFGKGNMLAVSGSLQSRKWQDRDGNNRISWEVNVDRAFFTGEKTERAGETPRAVNVAPPEYHELDDDDGDIPF